jgi:hypothetical protein
LRRQRKNESSLEYDPVENPYPYIGEKERFLIGWPGYRTRPEKFGLTYMETQAEWGHMQGVLIRCLITGKFISRNPFYLACLTFYGIVSISPILILAVPDGHSTFLTDLLFVAPNMIIGFLILINLVLGLINYEKGESITGD